MLEKDERSAWEKFDDEITALIDNASEDLKMYEMIGCLEIQLHILKNRAFGYQQVPPGHKLVTEPK